MRFAACDSICLATVPGKRGNRSYERDNNLCTVLSINIVPSKLKKEIRFLTYFIPIKLASLNGKNNIDVIVNQFFRELPKRWMLLQNTTEKRRLQISREKILYFIYDTL